MELDTILIHGGWRNEKDTGACAVPIYQTSAFSFENTAHAAALFDGSQAGNIYTRIMNPTTDVFEKRMALLEGGVGALATSSGMSAVLVTVLTLCQAGDEIVSSTALYGGTFNLFSVTLKTFGIKVNFIDSNNPKDFEAAITDKTKFIYAETLANPKLIMADLEALADVAHRHNIPFVVDSTVTPPPILKPIEFGADIVIHSATKFIGGHGTSIAGVIVDSGKFDWEKSGKFEDLGANSPYGNEAPFIVKARAAILRDTGCAISPFNAFMLLQGMQTLSLRMEKHCSNAARVAEFLKNSEYVEWVNYPTYSDDPNFKKYLKNGYGAMLGFGIKGGIEAGAKFIDNVKLLTHIANLGDTRTLVIHPASTTHQQLKPQERIEAGATDDFIRLCVGIEDAKDIIADMEQALKAACS